MDITSRLRIEGNENAFMVNDAGHTYPVFAESLHTTGIFQQLISSGYRLCGLPYDFKKDGVSIMSLPCRDYMPTEDELQDMFDFNSLSHMSADELRSNISEEEITYLPEPPAKYTIATREEFMEYLRSIRTATQEEDYKPINYFVHPSARFTIDEWKSGEYIEYFRIMESRRAMSYQKFRKLRQWLTNIGMEPNGDAIDIVEYYNMWGIDGLNAKFVAKQRKTLTVYEDFVMQPGMEPDAYEITRTEDALVDRYGAVFPPEDVQPGYNGWQVSYPRGKESAAFRNKIAALKENEFGVVTVRTKLPEDILLYSTLKDTIKVTPYQITCGETRMFNMSVTMPDITAKQLAAYWWSARYEDRVNTMSNLRALAYTMLEQRRYTADVSTYKALLEVGCDVKGALMYMIDKSVDKYNNSPEALDDDAEEARKEFPTEAEVDLYVNGDIDLDTLPELTQIRIETLKDMVNGVVNLDGVAAGARADASINVDEVYKFLYCAHFCRTHISLGSMYNSLKEVDKFVVEHTDTRGLKDFVVPMVADGFTVNVPCPEIKEKINGYKADIKRYKVRQSEQCCGFLKVVQIAKEYGTPECVRHVAFEAQTVNLIRNSGIARKNLEQLMEIFEDQLRNYVPLARQNTYRLYKRSTCMQEYFRVAEQGVMKFPSDMGGQTVPVSNDLVLSIQSTITNRITSTAVYCKKMYDEGFLTHYCVNADITPWTIYPKVGAKIPAASLPALWYDWAAEGAPQITSNLLSNGGMYRGFVAWTRRYYTQRYFSLDGLPAEMDLTKYMAYCNRYRDTTKITEEFKNAPHIETLLYGMFPDETVREDNGVALRARGEVPAVMVSKGEIVMHDAYPSHGKLQITHGHQVESLKRFKGFEADDYDMLGSVIKVTMPQMSDKYITTDGESISTDEQENMPAYAVAQLVGMGYPIINLWGRKYIFRDLFGALWEVII